MTPANPHCPTTPPQHVPNLEAQRRCSGWGTTEKLVLTPSWTQTPGPDEEPSNQWFDWTVTKGPVGSLYRSWL